MNECKPLLRGKVGLCVNAPDNYEHKEMVFCDGSQLGANYQSVGDCTTVMQYGSSCVPVCTAG